MNALTQKDPRFKDASNGYDNATRTLPICNGFNKGESPDLPDCEIHTLSQNTSAPKEKTSDDLAHEDCKGTSGGANLPYCNGANKGFDLDGCLQCKRDTLAQ